MKTCTGPLLQKDEVEEKVIEVTTPLPVNFTTPTITTIPSTIAKFQLDKKYAMVVKIKDITEKDENGLDRVKRSYSDFFETMGEYSKEPGFEVNVFYPESNVLKTKTLHSMEDAITLNT